jgi:peptidoglycan/LPS O-acetylase OafA/YrhL
VSRAPFRLGYQPGLDGLRGVSLLLIMVFHSFLLWPESYARGVPGSYLAVNVFFVLSGFLITSLLLAERERNGRVAFGAFYMRRVLRLLPALALVFGVDIVYLLSTHQAMRSQLSLMGWAGVYASNWMQWAGHVTDPVASLTWGHTWTLSVEEQFYLVWPTLLLVVLIRRIRLEVVGGLLLACAVALTVLRTVAAYRVSGAGGAVALAGRLDQQIGMRTDFRADSLLLGGVAAIALHAGWRPGRGLRAVATALLAALVATQVWVRPEARWMYGWGFTLFDAALALLCVALLDRRWLPAAAFRWGPLVWVGRVSYGLYLWHPPVFMAVTRAMPHGRMAARLLWGWGLTFVLAATSFYLVEQPFLRLKGRWERRGDPSPAGGPVAVTQGALP